MALTLQRKLELAGDLSRVQPLLQRLHIVEKPKERHIVRNVIFVSGTIAAGAVVVCRRRGCCSGAVAGNGGDARAGSPTQDTSDIEPDGEGLATHADGSQDIGASRPA